ncbi:Ig-like domain-containing protein [Peptococcus simiae]|uniref:Ig-like domain-containing protein n=1 Tax=Peptococcus simiae TaxID=1643805 RepID=A0ABW9GXB3_9FIRM
MKKRIVALVMALLLMSSSFAGASPYDDLSKNGTTITQMMKMAKFVGKDRSADRVSGWTNYQVKVKVTAEDGVWDLLKDKKLNLKLKYTYDGVLKDPSGTNTSFETNAPTERDAKISLPKDLTDLDALNLVADFENPNDSNYDPDCPVVLEETTGLSDGSIITKEIHLMKAPVTKMKVKYTGLYGNDLTVNEIRRYIPVGIFVQFNQEGADYVQLPQKQGPFNPIRENENIGKLVLDKYGAKDKELKLNLGLLYNKKINPATKDKIVNDVDGKGFILKTDLTKKTSDLVQNGAINLEIAAVPEIAEVPLDGDNPKDKPSTDYVRLTFDTAGKQEKTNKEVQGKFTNESYKDKTKLYLDVKKDTEWRKIKAFLEAYTVEGNGKEEFADWKLADSSQNTCQAPSETDPKKMEPIPNCKVDTFNDSDRIGEDKTFNALYKYRVSSKDVEVSFDGATVNDDANAPRDGEEIVKGKVTPKDSAAILPGAKVEIKVSDGQKDVVIGTTTVGEDGTFSAGTNRKLKAGETVKVVVTLVGADEAAQPVEKKVGLNPDKLNTILPTADKVLENFKGKEGINEGKYKELDGLVKDAYDKLVNKAQDPKDQINQKAKKAKEPTAENQKALDEAHQKIEAALKALNSNNLPKIEGPGYKEIFKGGDLGLDKVVVDVQATGEQTVANGYVILKDGDNVKANTTAQPPVQEYIDLVKLPKDGNEQDKKYYTLKVEKQKVTDAGTTWETVNASDIANINNTPGTYKVTYTIEDNKGATATHIMDLSVKELKDAVPQKPGGIKPNVPANFVKVEFKADDASHTGDNARGTISKTETTIYWVDPTKQVELVAPFVQVKDGYKHTGWDKTLTDTFAAATDITAQYKAKVVDGKDQPKKPGSNEVDPDYVNVTFQAGENGKFEAQSGHEQVTSFWVLKDEKVTFNPPTPTANENYTFKVWNPAVQEKYTEGKEHKAIYTSKVDISDQKVEGYQEVKFDAGTDGNFGTDSGSQQAITEKSVWVKPDTLVDLTDKAPQVTVTAKDKSFTGWSQKLVASFKKVDDPTVINAVYKSTVVTEDPKDKEHYAKVDFVAGNHGKFEQNAKTTYWVIKKAEVTLTPPKVTPDGKWTQKTGENAWSPQVAKSYTEDTVHTAQYTFGDNTNVVPQKPGEEKPKVPDNFVKVEFKPGTNGIISSEETTVYWVNPVAKNVKLTAPKVIATQNYKHTGWDKPLEGTFAQTTDITAQYKKKVVEGINQPTKPDPNDSEKTIPDTDYVKVTFVQGNHGTLEGTAIFWILKDEKVTFNPPKVKPAAGYAFDKWESALQETYKQETTHKAIYKGDVSISDTEIAGYQQITFKSGNDGNFAGQQEKSIWVKPGILVDLRKKAPEVTVTTEGKSHIGWDKDLVDTFTKANETTVINAVYSDSISKTPVPGWTEITFNQGDHGKFAGGAKNVLWVNPDKEVKLSDKAPVPAPDVNYSFLEWKDGNAKADLTKAVKYIEAKTFTASYESDFSDRAKDSFVKVIFKPGKNGQFAPNSTTETYVRKDKVVDLTEKAPTVISNQNWGHTGWNPALKGSFTEARDITAQYVEGKFDENNIEKITVIAPTKMAYGAGETLDLTGMKVIAFDKAGIQTTYDGEDAINKAGFKITPANGATLTVKDHDKKPIVVTKGEGQSKLEGQTQTVLFVDTNLSAKPEDVKALNQNKVVEGKVTEQPKETTTVTGKVAPKATVTITNEKGKEIGTATADDQGNFTAEVEKQKDGAKVTVKAQEKGKQPSDPKEATVARDANNDGKADADADQKTTTPTAKALNKGEKPAATTITGKATPNAKVVAKVGTTIVGQATANGQGDYTIEAKQNEQPLAKDTEVKVTAQEEGKLVSNPTATVVKVDKDGNDKADDEEGFEITKAAKVEILSNPDKMDYLVKTTDGKAAFDTAGLVIKLTDATGKTVTYTADELKNLTNEITLSPAEGEKMGLTAQGKTNTLPFKVTVAGTKATEKPSVTGGNVTVKLDADGNNKADEAEVSETPIATASNIGDNPAKTTVKGKAPKNATVTVKYMDGTQEKSVNVIAGDDGAFSTEIPKQGAGKEVTIIAKDGDKKDSVPYKTIVFDDKDGNGKDDATDGFDIAKADKIEMVYDPAKMNYLVTEKDGKASLETKGMLVKVTDKLGKVKTYTAKELAKDTTNFTVAPAEGTQLGLADNDKPIKVTLKAEKATTKEVSTSRNLSVKLDANNNGIPDDQEQFDLAKATKVEILSNPDKMDYLVKTKDGEAAFDTAGLVIKLTDAAGKTATYTGKDLEKEGIKDKITLNPANGIQLGLTEGKDFTVTVTGADAQTKPTVTADKKITVKLDADNSGKPDVDETTAEPTVIASNKGEKGKESSATKTTVEVKTAPKASVTIEYQDKNGEKQTITADADAVGNVTKIIEPKLDAGTEIKVTVKDGEKKPATKTANVFDDLDNDGKPDDQAGTTERPAAIASNKGKAPAFTTITGKTEPGATITVKVKEGEAYKDVTIENFNIDGEGNYSLGAKYNGKPLAHGADIQVFAAKAPKTVSAPQTTTVFTDKDENGKPDDGRVDLKDVKDIQVLGPEKLDYNESDEKNNKLDLTKLQVLVTDNKGGIEMFDYNTRSNTFKDVQGKEAKGFEVKVGDKTVQQNTEVTSADYNGKPITVKYSDGGKAGISRNLTVVKDYQKPNVDSINHGDKVVTVTVPKDDKINKITINDGQGHTITVTKDANGWKDGKGQSVDSISGKLQIKVEEPAKIEEGNVVTVTTEDGQGNKAAARKVVKAQATTAVPTELQAANQGATPTETVIKGKAPSKDAIIKIYNKNGEVTPKGKVTMKEDGRFEVKVDKQEDNSVITVTATETGKKESPRADAKVIRDKNSDWKEDGGNIKLNVPNVEPIKAGAEQVVVDKPTDDSITTIIVKDQAGKTVEIKMNGDTWPGEKDGKITIPTKDKLTFGPNQTVEIKVKDNEGNEGTKTLATQPADLEAMEKPTINPISTDSTSITGKTVPGSKVIVILPDGAEKEASVKSDGSFKLDLEKPLVDKSKVTVKATNPQREGEKTSTAIVGLNITKLEKTDKEADSVIDKAKKADPKNWDLGKNPYDKNLDDKSKAAKDVLDKAKDKNPDNDPTQSQVNKAEKDLRDAINQKDADDKVKVVEKVVKEGEKPTPEQIETAQEAIDKVVDEKAKKDLQDRLDKAKTVDELVDKLKEVPKEEDEGYQTKPAEIVKKLEEAKDEAEKLIDKYKNPTKDNPNGQEPSKEELDKAKQGLEDGVNEYNKEQVVISITEPSADSNQLEITSLQPEVKLTIYVGNVEQHFAVPVVTTNLGKATVNLNKPLVYGQEVTVVGSKEGLLDMIKTATAR